MSAGEQPDASEPVACSAAYDTVLGTINPSGSVLDIGGGGVVPCAHRYQSMSILSIVPCQDAAELDGQLFANDASYIMAACSSPGELLVLTGDLTQSPQVCPDCTLIDVLVPYSYILGAL